MVHAWRGRPESPDLDMPDYLQDITGRPVIVFDHDWEGNYKGIADLVVLVYSTFAAACWLGLQRVARSSWRANLDRFLKVAHSRNWSRMGVVGRLSTLHPGKMSPSNARILASP